MTTTPALSPTSPTRRSRADAPSLQLRREAAQLREQLGKLAALVDHYYAAYQDTQGMLARRERELAELRRRLETAPVSLRRV
jgi:transcription elongation GreA/GreB family factor